MKKIILLLKDYKYFFLIMLLLLLIVIIWLPLKLLKVIFKDQPVLFVIKLLEKFD